MSTADAILRSILEEPDDDTLRLIYADWLEDSGDAARAEFVRWSVAFAKLRSCHSRDQRPGSPCWCQACKEWPFCPAQPPLALQLRWPHDDMAYLPDFGTWRGLPEVWAVPDVPTFEREAAAVFAAHPIRRVVLRCRVPCSIGQRPFYEHPEDCSPELWAMLGAEIVCIQEDNPRADIKWYATPGLARADLESALAARGRILAKLPALEPTP